MSFLVFVLLCVSFTLLLSILVDTRPSSESRMLITQSLKIPKVKPETVNRRTLGVFEQSECIEY